MTAIEILDELREKIEAGEYMQAEVLVNDLRNYYANNPEEKELFQAALTIRGDETFEKAQQVESQRYIEHSASVKFFRSSILANVGTFLLNPEEADASNVAGRIDTLQTNEQDLNTAGSEIQDIVETETLPPKIVVTSMDDPGLSFPLDKAIPATISVSNIGDGSANSVEWELNTPVSVTAEPLSGTVGSIDANSIENIDVGITGSNLGTFELSVEVGSENAGNDTAEFSITVVGKVGSVELAIDEINKLISMTESLDVSTGIRNSLLQKLEQAIRLSERTFKFIEESKLDEANQKLREAKAVVEDYKTEVEDLSGVQLSSESAAFLVRKSEHVIEILETAHMASVAS